MYTLRFVADSHSLQDAGWAHAQVLGDRRAWHEPVRVRHRRNGIGLFAVDGTTEANMSELLDPDHAPRDEFHGYTAYNTRVHRHLLFRRI
jgi:hypothetical protein